MKLTDIQRVYFIGIGGIGMSSLARYFKLLDKEVAKECARMVLPMCSPTRLYINGSVRSWVHYLKVRCGNGTQKEHIEIANQIKEIFKKEFPIVYEACFT